MAPEPLFTFPSYAEADPNRIVIGYHGTDYATANTIVTTRHMERSENPWDWLGHGIYFWEDDPQRAREWADQRLPGERVQVVVAEIRLRRCLNLLNRQFIALVQHAERAWEQAETAQGRIPTTNQGGRHARDCAVLNYLCDNVDYGIDTLRGAFREGDQMMPGSALYELSHVQLCVRNPACIESLRLCS